MPTPIPFLDSSQTDPTVPLRIPFLDQPAQPAILSGPGPAPDASAPLTHIGDDTPLGRFAQPILPAPPPPPTAMVAPTPGQADRNAERTRLEQDRSELLKPHFGQAGSAHPGWGGKILHGLAEAGNIAGDFLDPKLMASIRGTDENNQIRLNEDNTGLNELGKEDQSDTNDDASNALKGAQTAQDQALTAGLPQEQADKHAVSGATVDSDEAEAWARRNPASDWKPLPGYTGPNGEPLEIDSKTGQTRPAPGGSGAKPAKESTPQQQTFDSLIAGGMTPVQAYEKIREKPGGTTINEGTWQLAEDGQGNPILFNSKTSATKAAPDGLQKVGTAAKAEAKKEAAEAPVEGAMNYADSYMKNGVFTGSGDEALQEKFFELAKPSTGFRMSQPQIDMLQNARSWMSSMSAHVRHATSGTWFDPTQRSEIVSTMRDLYQAKKATSEAAAKGGGAKGGGAKGGGANGGGGGDANAPKVGDIRPGDGGNYRFKGGDQFDKSNWELVKK